MNFLDPEKIKKYVNDLKQFQQSEKVRKVNEAETYCKGYEDGLNAIVNMVDYDDLRTDYLKFKDK